LALHLKDEYSKRFVYTSDIGFSENLAPFAAGMFFQEKQISEEVGNF